jgi:bifunctional UDP-N-acetylglucosamine pyrophosphorylase/glucosamine-1-phosphate N-acetyltransferase
MTSMSRTAMSKSTRNCLAVVLAAGEGTRMRSEIPKVLHRVAGGSMLSHVLRAVGGAGAEHLAVVVGPGRDDVTREALALAPHARIFVQSERRGTAHAVLTAEELLTDAPADIVVAFADTPLVTPETFSALRAPLAEGSAVSVLGFEARDPTGYGRLLTDEGRLVAIREEKDASADERRVTLCNAGLMALRGDVALALLRAVRDDNAKREFYLTDVVALAAEQGLLTSIVLSSEDEVQGVNDRTQLAVAEKSLQARLRREAMLAGVTLVDPDSVFFSHDTKIARDVVVEPHVFFGVGVVIESGAVIHAFSHLEGATVSSGASVGPYARLRPGARLASNAKVGNFVEIKNADIGADAKVSHLTYVGDASVGAGANIGAGTITCNYDGFSKYRTVIGAGAFIGSNSALVAPVTIGQGAFVGSGSVITEDVPPDGLAVARGRQVVKDAWAVEFRAKSKARKLTPRGG